MTERFIAFAISSVSRVPEAPTSMPATISTVFESTKPVAEAARPVTAFSSEITTGMSAPPIGSTKRTPKRSAKSTSSQITHCWLAPAIRAMPRAMAPRKTAALKTFWPGKVIGRPLTSSCSFAKATSEPAKEIDPIRAESTVETIGVAARLPSAMWNSEIATRAAAPPPTPLNSATIWGIAVIFTLRAPKKPTIEPIAAPTTIRTQFEIPSRRRVLTIAMIMPTPPIQFPRRACFGDERNFSARMKQMIVTR